MFQLVGITEGIGTAFKHHTWFKHCHWESAVKLYPYISRVSLKGLQWGSEIKDYHNPPPDVLSRKKLVEMDIRTHYQINNSPVTTICQKATQMVWNWKCLAMQQSWEEMLGLELLLCKSFCLKVNIKVFPLPSVNSEVSCLSVGHQDNIENPQLTWNSLVLHSNKLIFFFASAGKKLVGVHLKCCLSAEN